MARSTTETRAARTTAAIERARRLTDQLSAAKRELHKAAQALPASERAAFWETTGYADAYSLIDGLGC